MIQRLTNVVMPTQWQPNSANWELCKLWHTVLGQSCSCNERNKILGVEKVISFHWSITFGYYSYYHYEAWRRFWPARVSHIHVFLWLSGFCSSNPTLPNDEIKWKKNQLFNNEKARQLSLITRVEKITVEYKGPPENCTLIMNKNLSTPHNCAMRKYKLSRFYKVS